ncbi:MAG: hypothetical protein N2315_04190 [Thermanaerothrix sp.]|nr:hypothetical protein [Thermanaerothrix sp.]
MDQARLIDAVVKEVMRRLEGGCSGGGGFLVLGEPGSLPSSWGGDLVFMGEALGAEGFDRLLVPRLDQCQLVACSLGMWCDAVSKALVGGLSRGAEVFLLKEALGWMDLLPPQEPLGKHYRSCLERLCSFGVRLVSSPSEIAGVPLHVASAPGDAIVEAERDEKGALDLRGMRLISEREIKDRCPEGCREILVDAKAIITPLCMDLLRVKGIDVVRGCGG